MSEDLKVWAKHRLQEFDSRKAAEEFNRLAGEAVAAELNKQVKSEARRARTLPSDSAARKDIPLWSGLFCYFPAALAAVAQVSAIGNKKHNPGQPLHHARGKSSDHQDCVLRHMLDGVEANGRDENGIPECAYEAWRALAHCQEWLEKHDGAPLAPGAKLPESSNSK